MNQYNERIYRRSGWKGPTVRQMIEKDAKRDTWLLPSEFTKLIDKDNFSYRAMEDAYERLLAEYEEDYYTNISGSYEIEDEIIEKIDGELECSNIEVKETVK